MVFCDIKRLLVVVVMVSVSLENCGLNASPISKRNINEKKDLIQAESKPSSFKHDFNNQLKADDGIGFHKTTDSKGDNGYKHYETFHKKDGDAYGYEKHEGHGEGEKNYNDDYQKASSGHSNYSSDDGDEDDENDEDGGGDDDENEDGGGHNEEIGGHEAGDDNNSDDDDDNNDDDGDDSGKVDESSEKVSSKNSDENEHSSYKNHKQVETGYENDDGDDKKSDNLKQYEVNENVKENYGGNGGNSPLYGFETRIVHFSPGSDNNSAGTDPKSGQIIHQFQNLYNSPKVLQKPKQVVKKSRKNRRHGATSQQ